MKIEIAEERENKLFDRKELLLRITYDSNTPRWSEVRDKLVGLVNADKEVVILDSIRGRFGVREAQAHARIYKTKDQALEVENKHTIRANFPGEGGEARKEKKEEPKEKPAKGTTEKKSAEKPASGSHSEKPETKGG